MKVETVVAYYLMRRAENEDQTRLFDSIDNRGRLRRVIPLLRASPNDFITQIDRHDTRGLNRMEILAKIPKKVGTMFKIVIVKNPASYGFQHTVRQKV